jgi:hypothetical protein
MAVHISKYASLYATRYNWHLIPLQESSKLPLEKDWGNNCVTDPAAAQKLWADRDQLNIGLELGGSRMCSLDIDDAESFSLILEEYGLPEDSLDEYPTIKGKGKRVMFRVPDDVDLPYCKLNWPRKDDPKKHFTVVELRAGDGKQRFDVLPPSVHPDTKQPYTWLVQPPKKEQFPEPPGWLLAIWTAWSDFKPQFQDACPWAVAKPKPPAPKLKQPAQEGSQDVIGLYCDANPITSTLERYGYTCKGKRYLSPHSGTGLAGVHILDAAKCWIHHASDPLCSEETGQPVNSFDLYCYYDHDSDMSKAVKAAAEALGLKREPRPIPPKPEQEQVEADPFEQAEGEQLLPAVHAQEPDQDNNEFLCLGYNDGNAFFLPSRSEQVTRLPMGGIKKQNLLQLAPLEWWESVFPAKNGVEWDQATNSVIRWCEQSGVYDPNNQRGRGAWFDDGRSVLHLGNRLLVDGEPLAISSFKSKFIYTKQATLDSGVNSAQASDEEARKLASLIGELNWGKDIHGPLMAGWVMLAPICGALSWRPHMWITAQRGAGKSWTQENIIDKLVGRTMLYCQGGTTEAGIRQQIQADARPVMFDEAESEDVAAAKRIQSVIELARQASSDTGAQIMKGTVSGSGMAFRMRAMFLMGSINVSLKQAADESRFTVVQLTKAVQDEAELARFRDFENRTYTLLSEAYCASIRARAYHMIPIIRANAKTLASAVAAKLKSQRIGDQVGTLLAGFFALDSRDELTPEQATALIAGLDFSESKEAEQVSDEDNCLNRIMERQIRLDGHTASVTRSVGELVNIALGERDAALTGSDANDTLGRHGLKQEGLYLLVANSHSEIEKSLSGTPWESGWRRILARLDGAVVGVTGTRFAGSLSRYIKVPISLTK